MFKQTPPGLRAAGPGRVPFPPDGHRELFEVALEERITAREAELDRATGRVDLDVPPTPEGPFRRRHRTPLPPVPDATGGNLPLVRNAWMVKYNPHRAQREQHLPVAQRQIANSDVWRDFEWGRPSRALAEPWVSSWLLRGAPEGLLAAQVGDLVFVLRSDYLPGVDHPWLARRAVVGLWWVESISEWTEQTPSGPLDCAEAACFPVRRFDFPVPVIQTGQMDKHFYKIKTLRDRSRRAMMRLTDQEALAMARNCGLPAAVLTEPDPDRLAPLCAGLDLGPPDMVRRRIQQGAKAVAHRDAVEASARDVAVAALRREGFGVVSTEDRRGVGSDLWAAGCEADGTETHVRVEVKGLGQRPVGRGAHHQRTKCSCG